MKENLVYKVFAKYPFMEITFRVIMDKFSGLKKIGYFIYNNIKFSNDKQKTIEGLWDEYKKAIRDNCEITEGDLVLVHSSIKGLKTLGVDASEILDYIEYLVGDEGTIVVPVYPDMERIEYRCGVPVYDPDKSVPWTGKIPRVFLKRQGVYKSLFPHNTLAAKGKEAEDIIKGNIENTAFSQGKGSSWDFCINGRVKILYLGVKACTSCTVVHYAEDIMEERWPIANWHLTHKYIIKMGSEEIEFETKERDEKWFKYYKMFNTGKKLKEQGFLREYDVNGAYLGVMDKVKEMSEWIIDEAKEGRLLFGIPRRYWKDEYKSR